MHKFYPSLRIHVWGGLGSQLFAVALAFSVSKRFPGRELILALHSSGVTKRRPEVCELFPEFNYIEIDDYSTRESHDSQSKKWSLEAAIRGSLRFGALYTGILAEENHPDSRLVHRWTLSVRGHYFHRKIEDEFLTILKQRLAKISKLTNGDYRSFAIIHYRLGDLLELSNRSWIDARRIRNVIYQIVEVEAISVLSDSPPKALSLLQEESYERKLQAQELTTAETIWAGSQAKVFVGTSSKISYWIVLLRLANTQKLINFMPKEDRKTISIISGKSANVEYY
jgi:hypothetical protein